MGLIAGPLLEGWWGSLDAAIAWGKTFWVQVTQGLGRGLRIGIGGKPSLARWSALVVVAVQVLADRL